MSNQHNHHRRQQRPPYGPNVVWSYLLGDAVRRHFTGRGYRQRASRSRVQSWARKEIYYEH